MKADRLTGLDELRGLAAAFVVLAHLGPVLGPEAASPLLAGPAWGVGVDLFFVLSGFLAARSLRGLEAGAGRGRAVATYYRRRVLRILPLTWVVAIMLAIAAWMLSVTAEPSDVWAALSFSSNVHWAPCFGGASGCGDPFVFAPFWSLATEAQFYLVAPLALFGLSRRSVVAIAALVLVMGLIVHRPWGGALWTFRLDAIMVGVAIAVSLETTIGQALVKKLRPIGPAEATFWLAIAAVAMAILPPAAQGPATVALAVLCGVLVVGAARRTGASNLFGRALRWVARISLALYLVHLPILAGARLWLGDAVGVELAVLAGGAVAIAAAWMLTVTIGEPLCRLGRRRPAIRGEVAA